MTTNVLTTPVLAQAATSAWRATPATELRERASAEVARRLESTIRTAGQVVTDAQRALEVLQSASDYPAQLDHPSFRYLLAAIRRSWTTEPDRAYGFLTGGLADFAWPRQLLDGLGAGTWRSRTDADGGLRVGGLGRWLEFGAAQADTAAQIVVGDGRALVTLGSDGLTVEVLPEDLGRSGVGEPAEQPTVDLHGFTVHHSVRTAGGVCVDARDPWLRPVISGTNQRTDGIGFYDSTWEPYRREPHLASIEAGLAAIGACWPEAVAELTGFVGTIVPLSADETAYSAFTVLSRQGAVYVGDAPAPNLAEMLLHETAHVKLRQMQLLDPVLTDPLDETFKVAVPWRPDPRPLPGVLEGVFVFCHVAEFQARRMAVGIDDLQPPTLERLVHLRRAYQVVAEHADLTETGQVVIDELDGWISDLEHRTGLR